MRNVLLAAAAFASIAGSCSKDPIVVDEVVDLDEDGFAADVDCDDNNATINPDATELCNGIDDDCDSLIDNDAADTVTTYADADGDGFGSGDAVESCEAPDSSADNDFDCDDTNTDINPDALEICNGIDDDCDPLTVDGEAETIATWFIDDDNDGFGSDTTTVESCEQPENGSAIGGDCDDGNADINPGADEVCNAGQDDDCDPTTNENEVDGGSWYEDEDQDGFGGNTLVLACEQPANTVANTDDCNDNNGDQFPGADERCNDVDDDCDPLTTEDDAVDALTWTEDGDMDGFGAVDGDTTQACQQPDGFAASADDCDDNMFEVNPDADEVCNGIDDDCDPLTSEDDLQTFTWYADADMDLFGDPNVSLQQCNQPDGFVDNDGDCDDTRSTVNPGITVDTCNDLDDDCDGTVDPGCFIEHCGPITSNETWSAGTTHLITCDVVVGGPLRPTLTIDDGATVLIDDGFGLLSGTTATGRIAVLGDELGVTFTTSSDAPEPGIWKGLQFGVNDDGSVLTGIDLSYGGGNGSGGVFAQGADIEIADSTIRNSLSAGIRLTSGSLGMADTQVNNNIGPGVQLSGSASLAQSNASTRTFSGNTVSNNAGDAVAVFATDLSEIGDDTVISDNDVDAVVVQGGTVDRTATWVALDAPYRIQTAVNIQGVLRPTVTLEGGATLEFDAGIGLTVGNGATGKFVVQGPDTTFTSSADDPTPGSWAGLSFGRFDDGSTLSGTRVEWAGGNGHGSIDLNAADVTIANSTIAFGIRDGVSVRGSSTLQMTDTTVANHLDMGVDLAATACFTNSGFSGNTVRDNGDHGVHTPPECVGDITPGNSFSGNSGAEIAVQTGTVTTSQTWSDHNVPYRLLGNVSVEAAISPRLTIDDGAEFEAQSTAGLLVGNAANGELRALGAVDGISFSSTPGNETPGAWSGITLGRFSRSSTLEGVTVQFAGGNGHGGVRLLNGNLTDAKATLTDCVLANNVGHGLKVENSEALVTGSTFRDNLDDGINVADNARLDTTNAPSFKRNTLTGNRGDGLELPAQFAAQIDATSQFAGNDEAGVLLRADVVTTSGIWPALDVAYEVLGTVNIEGSTRPVITIQDGAELRFRPNTGLTVGNSTDGGLVATGLEDGDGVLFTSAASSPTPGDWLGVTFGRFVQQSSLANTTLEYGGGNGHGNIRMLNANLNGSIVTLTNVVTQRSSVDGVRLENSTASMQGLHALDNLGNGVLLTTTAQLATSGGPTFRDCVLRGNGGHGIYLPPEYVRQIDKTCSWDNNNGSDVRVRAGVVTSTGTWQNLGADITVEGSTGIEGPDQPVLTLEDGAVLRFLTNVELRVGTSTTGGLVADGDDGILLSGPEGADPGSWIGVQFGRFAIDSSMTSTTVRDGGGGGHGNIRLLNGLLTDSQVDLVDVVSTHSAVHGLRVDNSRVRVTGGSFSNNLRSGIWVETNGVIDSVEGPSVVDVTVQNNGEDGIRVPAQYLAQLDKSATFANNDRYDVSSHGGAVSVSGTWQDLDTPMVLTGTVTVEGTVNPRVTIEDGAELLFPTSGTSLSIGSSTTGGLHVQGGAERVLMHATPGVNDPGAWAGLVIGRHQSQTELVGLDIADAGGNGHGNIYLLNTNIGSNPTVVLLDGVVSTASATNGLRLSNSTARIVNSRFEDNLDLGILIDDNASIDAAGEPSFATNISANNGDGPIRLPANQVGQFAADASFDGPAQVSGGTVSRSATWPRLDNGYDMQGSVVVEGLNSPTLTIAGGNTLRFPASAQLSVGSSTTGSLHVLGGSDEVVFTSTATSKQPGQWLGIVLGRFIDEGYLTGARVEYAGGNGHGNLYLLNGLLSNGSDVVLDGVTSTRSSANGLRVSNSEVEVLNSAFTFNNQAGVRVETNGRLMDTASPSFVNNTVTDNAGDGISLNADDVDMLDITCSFADNDVDIDVRGGAVTQSTTWKRQDAPYTVSATVTVGGATNPVLRIDPGTTLAFEAGQELQIGLSDDGSLHAAGTNALPVTFTSAHDNPAANPWGGVHMGIHSDDIETSPVLIEHAIVEYGGSTGFGNIRFNNTSGTVDNTVCRNSVTWGVHLANSPSVVLSNMSYSGNANGNVN